MLRLLNKNILLGISGGIAAYKSAELVRRLRESGAQVRVVMTKAAQAFITPLTLQALSGNPVHTDLLDTHAEAAMGHIELARWADAVIIAPASADIIARLAHGHANDLLTTLCLATRATVAIAPAMNQQMWQHAAVQDNLQQLAKRGVHIIEPASGEQACGDVGIGRLPEPAHLLLEIANLFVTQSLSGKQVLITAGSTRELLDPIRYISNRSSGKMGYALAQAAQEAGAQVTLISGKTALQCPPKVGCIEVESAEQMYKAVMHAIKDTDIFIGCAAVADYRCAEPAQKKLSKLASELTLKLVRNPDILAAVTALPKPPFSVGFAAQTEDLIGHAQQKLKIKQVHMLAANLVGQANSGFESDLNALTVLWEDGQHELPLMPKTQLARELIALIAERYHAKHSS